MIMVLLAASCASPVTAADKKPEGKGKAEESRPSDGKSEEKTDKSAGANTGLKAFGQMIPLGSRSRGVRIPSFDNGKPSSLITADAMTRLDDEQLFSEKMIIEVYADKKEEDMRIDMKTGTYHMGNQILSSTERSRVSRSDFQIEGDSMVYDTKTAQGKMVGNVEMIIYDASAASKKMNVQTGGKSSAESPGKPEKPSAGNPEQKPAK